MNKVLTAYFLVFLFGLPLTHSTAFANEARDIMLKNEENRRLPEWSSKATLTTVKKDSAKKEKVFTVWRKLKSDGVRFQTLTRFHAPAEVKGEGILFLENDQGENDIQIYLPAYRKIRRVERAQQSGSFMGSDFSYTDITTQHVDDYEYKKMGEETCPTEDSKNIKCSIIEGKPARKAVLERTGYSRFKLWVRVDNAMVVKSYYWDLEGKDLKETISSNMKQVSDKWFVHENRMKNLKTGSQTDLIFQELKSGSLSSALFTPQNLMKDR